jgi:uncharacterized membrane protein YphA (DoxX/SURF4 family)
MEAQRLKKINLIGRYALAFVFIYHGVVPKLLWLSPTEIALTNAHHLDATIVAPIAGVIEILLGISIVVFRNSLAPVYVGIVLLIALLLDVILIMPSLLIGAFNPVSINIAIIVIAYFVCVTQSYVREDHN